MLELTAKWVLASTFYMIVTRHGEIGSIYVRFVNMYIQNHFVNKLFTCAKCMAFWTSLTIHGDIALSAIVFVLTFIIEKALEKI